MSSEAALNESSGLFFEERTSWLMKKERDYKHAAAVSSVSSLRAERPCCSRVLMTPGGQVAI